MIKGRPVSLVFGGIALSAALWSLPASADVPLQGLRHKLGDTDDHWRLDDQDPLVLSVFQGQSEIPYARYKLTGCRFCSGEDDNCEKDGIAEINFISQPYEPILAVTCHVGAHSQRLQILTPSQNQNSAAYRATGDYYIMYEQAPDHLMISYDMRKGDGTYTQTIDIWP